MTQFDETHKILCMGLRNEAHEQMREIMKCSYSNYFPTIKIILPISRRILEDHNIKNIPHMLNSLNLFVVKYFATLIRINNHAIDPEGYAMSDISKFFIIMHNDELEEIMEFK